MSAGLLEFGAERRHRVQPAAIPRTRSQQRELVMDIVHDRRQMMFFCVVQPQGSPDILMLGQSASRAGAVAAGEQFMSDYLLRHRTLRMPSPGGNTNH